MRAALVLVLLLLVVGCAHREQGDPKADDMVMPADFAGVVEYGNGSVPPPYHYEWRVTFDETTAKLEWTPGYDEGTESWTETADITDDQRKRLYEQLRDADAFTFDDHTDDGISGGHTGSAELTAGGSTRDTGQLGDSRAGQHVLSEVAEAVKALFSEQTWAGMQERQEEWGAQQ